MDKRLAELIIAAAVTIVGEEHQQLKGYFFGGSPNRSR
jgi:hypothetical protein